MQAHGRFQQEAWTYDGQVLDHYREAVLLHERLVPYIRAAAATAARSGLPAMRPLCLVDPSDPEGWAIADSYFLGPALWVAPVLEEGARSRRTYLPRGEWICWWTGERLEGGRLDRGGGPARAASRSGCARARSSSPIRRTGSARASARRTLERPIEATLWGEPRLGRASARSGGRHRSQLAQRQLVGQPCAPAGGS